MVARPINTATSLREVAVLIGRATMRRVFYKHVSLNTKVHLIQDDGKVDRIVCKSDFACWGNGECNAFLNTTENCFDGGDCRSRYGKTADCNSTECCTEKNEKCRRHCVCTQMSSMTKEQYYNCVFEGNQNSVCLQIFKD